MVIMIKYQTFLKNNENFNLEQKGNVICIGFFDGIHKMHKAIFSEAKRIAKEKNFVWSIITFSEKVSDFLKGIKNTLQSKNNKYENIEKNYKPDYIFEIEVNNETIKLNPNEFCLFLKEKLNVKKIVIGDDFRFAYKGQGNISHLQDFFGVENIIVFKRILNISTSLLKSNLAKGEISEVNKIIDGNFSARFKRNRENSFLMEDYNINIANGKYLVLIEGKTLQIELENNIIKLKCKKELLDIEFLKKV